MPSADRMFAYSRFHPGLECPVWLDSVEKFGFSNGLNSGTTTTGEPTHHIECFFGPSMTFAALLQLRTNPVFCLSLK
jgi:hypothetical protein